MRKITSISFLISIQLFALTSVAQADQYKAAKIDCDPEAMTMTMTAVHSETDPTLPDSGNQKAADIFIGVGFSPAKSHLIRKICKLGPDHLDVKVDYTRASSASYCGSDPSPLITLKLNGQPIKLDPPIFDETCRSGAKSISSLVADLKKRQLTVTTGVCDQKGTATQTSPLSP